MWLGNAIIHSIKNYFKAYGGFKMSYLVIGDSCMDMQKKEMDTGKFIRVPLTLQIEDEIFIDDETFNQAEFIKKAKQSSTSPKSACPAPAAFLAEYEKADVDMVFVVTLSEHLSGTYNSALVAKNMFYEKHGEDGKKIHVFSSDSASCGEAVMALKIREYCEAGKTFDEIVSLMDDFRYNMLTVFVLESLDALRKNGRLTGIQALLASALNIKPLMIAHHGVIGKLDQARGIQKSLNKLVEYVAVHAKETKDKVLSITHCNCPERAEFVKNEILKRIKVKDTYIVEAAGVATLYASDGGIIVSI